MVLASHLMVGSQILTQDWKKKKETNGLKSLYDFLSGKENL